MSHVAQPANEIEARELALFATNDGTLYAQRAVPMIANLRKKKAKGVYRHDLAVTLFCYMADEAAKMYTKQFGGNFSPATRRLAAEQILSDYQEQIDA